MKKLLIVLASFLLCIGLQAQCSVSISDSELDCFGDCNGTLTAVATGNPPFFYAWSNGATTSTIQDFLCAGTYSVTVTDADGCESSATGTLSEPNEIRATIFASDDGCNSDGPVELTAFATGGVGSYSYEWSNGENTDQLMLVEPGTYSVSVTDDNGCRAVANFTVVEYTDFSVEIDGPPLSCTSVEEVTLSAVIDGGIGPFSYNWNNFLSSPTITGSGDRLYSVTVTDGNGCQRIAEYDGRNFSVNTSGRDENCGEPGGLTARATVRGGTRPYTYTWSPAVPAPGESEQAELVPGTYFLTVSDATGCEATDSVVVVEAPELTLSFNNVENSCFNGCTGQASVEVTGGTNDFTYAWSNLAGNQTSATATGLCQGRYFVTVTDGNGCEVVDSVDISDLPEISVIETITDIDCSGECNGSIELEVSGGSSAYTYEWADLPFDGSNDRTQLCVGTYTVTITDENDCTEVRIYDLTEGIELSAAYILEEACNSGGPTQDGLVVTGGTMPYEYLWDDGSTDATLPRGSDPFAEHQVTITDLNGCSVELNDLRGYEVTQEEGMVLPLLSCQDGVMMPNAPLAGSTRSIITTEGDTVAGANYLFREVGNYTFLDLSAAQTCLIRGSITVFNNSLREEISLYSLDSFTCDIYNCLAVSGLTAEQRGSADLSITFYDPDGNSTPADENRQFCEVDRPGNYTVEVVLGCDTVRRSIEISEPIVCSTLSGFVYAESISNCSFDAEDIPVNEILVQIEAADGTVFHAISGIDGYYEISVPPGTYSLVALPGIELSENVCSAVTVAVSPAAAAVVDLFFQAPTNCFELRTWISSVTLRRCGFVNRLSVYYDNPSAVTAENVQLALELDPFYEEIITATPIASQFGNVLNFDLGTLAPFAFGRIDVFFQIECGVELGQTHCVRSLISPAGFCDEDGETGEALVNITEAGCEGDSIAFRVRNVGDQIMSVPLEYVVVEDGIMMRTNPFVEEALAPGEILDIILPATGATYQVITNQEPGVRVSNNPSWALEGCATSAGTSFTTGLVNILPLGNGVPWEDVICRQNTGSNDPNDKYGYPLGYDGGQIEPGTRIDYDIRFQNNGTDTAFTVTIRDTLSEALDISTLKMESGSHDYTTTLDTNRILTITFNNILLVDSLTNEPLSHGMVSFSIDHAPGLQPGDAIDNRVGIYFDNNEPVITNLSHHEIATEPLPNAVRYLSPNPVTLSVFPNPVTEELNVRALGRDIKPDQQLIITDLAGREVARTNYAATANGWNVQELATGYYMLVLLDDNGLALGRSGFVRM